jgi:large conductance mechanosensitive channel
MFKEFKEFAMRGNVLDMAIGIVIGAAFDTLAAAKAAGAATLNYGLFLNTVINFLIVAFAIFLLVRQVNRLAPKPAPAATPATRDCPYCLTAVPLKATKCAHCTSELRPA